MAKEYMAACNTGRRWPSAVQAKLQRRWHSGLGEASHVDSTPKYLCCFKTAHTVPSLSTKLGGR
eukprot:2084154-Prorocentrum_lima.AAC.1